jgi:hypothetical protein
VINDLMSLTIGLSGGASKLGRTEIDSLTVSTVHTNDMGPETAIIDADGAHPVERYDSDEAAVKGHEKWCAFIRGGNREITKLGYGSLAGAKRITLKD